MRSSTHCWQSCEGQVNLLHPGAGALDRPFFHCWFLSVPQLLVLLDDVDGAESFKQALWKTRHIVKGSSDFYHDYAWMQKAEVVSVRPEAPEADIAGGPLISLHTSKSSLNLLIGRQNSPANLEHGEHPALKVIRLRK